MDRVKSQTKWRSCFYIRKALRRNTLFTFVWLVLHTVPVTSEALNKYLWDEWINLELLRFLSAGVYDLGLFLRFELLQSHTPRTSRS